MFLRKTSQQGETRIIKILIKHFNMIPNFEQLLLPNFVKNLMDHTILQMSWICYSLLIIHQKIVNR